jgi:hypothetical protein
MPDLAEGNTQHSRSNPSNRNTAVRATQAAWASSEQRRTTDNRAADATGRRGPPAAREAA